MKENSRVTGLALLLFAQSVSGQDLRLFYRSAIDNTEQPYRLYVPSAYKSDGPALPLVIAMHGTGGNEGTLFDGDSYKQGALKAAAEKHEMLVVSPLGRGVTEYRGIGENDVFEVMEAVRSRYRVDPARIYLTGHSMGGTGAAYLALHHPDLFAAAAPLAAAYSFPWLARNAVAVPFLWIGGAADAEFYHRGVAVGVERMRKFGAPVMAEALPGEGHGGPVKDFDRVLGWLGKHKLDLHPRSYFFELDTPMHGEAWWTRVERIAQPGRMASIEAVADSRERVSFNTVNVAAFVFRPDRAVFDGGAPIEVVVNGRAVWKAIVTDGQELRIADGVGRLVAAKPRNLTAWRTETVATAPRALDMEGDEKPLANWITDAMRAATGTEIALWGGWAYRGLPIPAGNVDVVDLIQCSRPFDQYLVTVRMTGSEIKAILDDNVPHPKKDQPTRIDSPGASRLLQISGASYVFDVHAKDGEKIVNSTLAPDRAYRVVMEGQTMERQTAFLAGRFRKLDYESTEVPFTLALYGHAARTGRIEGRAEGRVRAVR
jgi:predicted esterase